MRFLLSSYAGGLGRLLPLLPVMLVAAAGTVSARGDHSELPANRQSMAVPGPAFRILFVGNSITRHGTNAAVVRELGWDHVSGMAATDEKKDYAHLLGAWIQAAFPDRPVQLDFASLVPGGLGTTAERLAPVRPFVKGHYDLVIIQHGEHERESRGVPAMKETYETLLQMFTRLPDHPMIICVGNWDSTGAADGARAYAGWSKVRNDTMRQECKRQHLPFVSVEQVALDPRNSGYGTNPGVRWHPNDRGQALYAIKIMKVFERQAAKRSWKLQPVRLPELAP